MLEYYLCIASANISIVYIYKRNKHDIRGEAAKLVLEDICCVIEVCLSGQLHFWGHLHFLGNPNFWVCLIAKLSPSPNPNLAGLT